MSEPKVFLLPDLGEGLTEAEIVNWLVAVGDVVRVDQPIAEVETAKSMVEVPSPYAGTVAVLHGEPGQTLDVGKPLISVMPVGVRSASGGRRRRRCRPRPFAGQHSSCGRCCPAPTGPMPLPGRHRLRRLGLRVRCRPSLPTRLLLLRLRLIARRRRPGPAMS